MTAQALASADTGSLALTLIALAVVFAITGLGGALIAIRLMRPPEPEPILLGEAAPSLVGKRVIVNTPRPDDQSIEGIVRAEWPDGAIDLAHALYLSSATRHGVDRIPAGDVRVPAASVSWLQLDVPEPATQE